MDLGRPKSVKASSAARVVRLGQRITLNYRALEIVDDGQEFPEQVGCGRLGLLRALALDALAVVVEFGGLAQQPLVELVALLLEFAGCFAGVGGRTFRGRRRGLF